MKSFGKNSRLSVSWSSAMPALLGSPRAKPASRPFMAIAGHLSRTMLEHYSHIRIAAKRAALESITKQFSSAGFREGVKQNVHLAKAESDARAI